MNKTREKITKNWFPKIRTMSEKWRFKRLKFKTRLIFRSDFHLTNKWFEFQVIEFSKSSLSKFMLSTSNYGYHLDWDWFINAHHFDHVSYSYSALNPKMFSCLTHSAPHFRLINWIIRVFYSNQIDFYWVCPLIYVSTHLNGINSLYGLETKVCTNIHNLSRKQNNVHNKKNDK